MSYSADENYKVYRETFRKARKAHTCSACRSAIAEGDYYCDLRWVNDYGAGTVKRCGSCQRTHEHLRKVCAESGYDDMWPDEELNCGLKYEDEWETEPPEEIAALPLLSAAERGALLAPKKTQEAAP